MSQKEIDTYIKKIDQSIENKRLKEAFESLNYLSLQLQNWQVRENLFELEENYKRMLSYLTEGIDDPQREKIYDDIVKSLYQISDVLELELKTIHTSSYFYDYRRSITYSHQEMAPADLIDELDHVVSKLELLNLLEDEANAEQIALEKKLEDLSRKIFKSVYLGGHWNSDTRKAWDSVVKNPLNPVSIPSLIISAVTLNLMEVFDEQKAMLLFEAAQSSSEEIRQRSITGILLFLRKYDKRLPLFHTLTSRLQHLSEDASFVKSVRHILLQFILSKETEKISKKIKDELLPKMMKMGPRLHNKFRIDEIIKDTGMDDKNPEWEKIIKDEGLQDQFQEITELQLEGADVMHSSFSHLKNYPFFSEISNWFVPFHTPAQYLDNKAYRDFAKILEASSMMCNSDKYSFFWSLSQMPEDYRKMMVNQFSSESSAVQEMLKEEKISESKKVGVITRQYIQDLYRFYKLFSRKKDFDDIFEASQEFYQIPSIFEIINSPDDLKVIGEYYFNKNHYEESSELFEILLKSDPDNDVLYQKRGYCLQQSGNLEEAVELYSRAEILNPNNTWVIKKLAHCYRLLKKPEDALIYYRKAEKLNPDNLSLQLNIGHCYLELKDYDEALKCYFKVEYLDSDSTKAWRPIAWCSFLTGKYDQALDYYGRIIKDNPNATDYLNAGHASLVAGKMEEAIERYTMSIRSPGNNQVKFAEAFTADIHDLLEAGIKEADIPFILDRIIYEL